MIRLSLRTSKAPRCRTPVVVGARRIREEMPSMFLELHRQVEMLLGGNPENRFLQIGDGGTFWQPNIPQTLAQVLDAEISYRPECWAYPLRFALACNPIRYLAVVNTVMRGNSRYLSPLITPRHSYGATHASLPIGAQVVWLVPDTHEKVVRTVTHRANLGDDLRLYRFDEPVTEVQSAMLLHPRLAEGFLQVCQRWVPRSVNMSNQQWTDFCLAVWVDQRRAAVPVTMYSHGWLETSSKTERLQTQMFMLPWKYRGYWQSIDSQNQYLLSENPLAQTGRFNWGFPVAGDSGTGACWVTPDNRAVAGLSFWSPVSGPSPSFMHDRIVTQLEEWGDSERPELYGRPAPRGTMDNRQKELVV